MPQQLIPPPLDLGGLRCVCVKQFPFLSTELYFIGLIIVSFKGLGNVCSGAGVGLYVCFPFFLSLPALPSLCGHTW